MVSNVLWLAVSLMTSSVPDMSSLFLIYAPSHFTPPPIHNQDPLGIPITSDVPCLICSK